MIEAIRSAEGREMARCVCDQCGRELFVPAAHGGNTIWKKPKPGKTSRAKLTIRTPKQVVVKLQSRGWAVIAGGEVCDQCQAARRKDNSTTQKTKEDTMSKGMTTKELGQIGAIAGSAAAPSPSEAPLPVPTAKQHRLIIMMLEDVYDDANKRYRGESTDKTVAEELGDGIRPGWVAQLREQFFGPAGGNEEMERLRADIAAWMKAGNDLAEQVSRAKADLAQAMTGMDHARAKVRELAERLDAICRNVGPKAGVAK